MKYRISLIALSALLAFSACKAEPERHYVKNDKDQEEEVIPEGNRKDLACRLFQYQILQYYGYLSVVCEEGCRVQVH